MASHHFLQRDLPLELMASIFYFFLQRDLPLELRCLAGLVAEVAEARGKNSNNLDLGRCRLAVSGGYWQISSSGALEGSP